MVRTSKDDSLSDSPEKGDKEINSEIIKRTRKKIKPRKTLEADSDHIIQYRKKKRVKRIKD